MKEGKHLSDVLADLGYSAHARLSQNVENVQAVGQRGRELAEGGTDEGPGPCSGPALACDRAAEPPREDPHG